MVIIKFNFTSFIIEKAAESSVLRYLKRPRRKTKLRVMWINSWILAESRLI